ncbi:MAG: prephenate dehydrogenase [Candidatus Omnitrophota bacterium]|jgi:prephenate dehydrogenase
MKFNKVAIIGVGLIGGSVGLAIRKKRLAREVIGVFRRASTLKKALKAKAVTRATMSIGEGVKAADLIIVAAPVYSIPALVKEAAKHAKKGAIITDVGSTKTWILNNVEKILKNSRSIYFVGSHPMAGSEHASVEFARADLLSGAPCIVTKDAKTDKAALKKVISFWASVGAKVKVLSPEAHDRSVSLISHLPHIVAFALAGAVPEKELQYAAEGFKDTTRVASSDPALWADIFLTNSKEIAKAARLFKKYCKDILGAVESGDYPKMVSVLKRAKAKRDKLIYGKERP